MTRQMSQSKRRAAFIAAASEMYDALEAWYDAHPEATYGEIELEARRHRRALMGQMLEVLVNGRDTGFQVEGVRCPCCGGWMEFKDYLPWTVYGLEGDMRLERAYYVCPECEGETLFPPGSEATIASGSLERRGGASSRPARAGGAFLRGGCRGLYGGSGREHIRFERAAGHRGFREATGGGEREGGGAGDGHRPGG